MAAAVASDGEAIHTMRPCARSCSTQTDSPASRTRPRRPTRSACSRAGSAAPTWRRSASRRPARCSGTRSWRGARTARAIALIHHLPCGECDRCLAGHESTCERFAEATIVPGGFAEEVEATDGIELPDAIGDALGTYLEPLACVLRGAERVPRGRVLVVGQGFVGRLFAAVLRGRGDDVFAIGRAAGAGRPCAGRPRRRGRPLRSRGAARRRRAGRHRPRLLPRRARSTSTSSTGNELTLTGSRSATPRHMRGGARAAPRARPARAARAAARALRGRARALPLRPRAQGRLHAVRALRFHGPGDLRLEDVPRPEPGPGDVLVQVEVALTDGTDLKAFRRGHPVLLRRAAEPVRARVLRDRRRHRPAGRRRQLGRDRRARRAARAPERRLRRAAARAGGDRGGQPPPRPAGARAGGGGDGRAARLLPARRRAGGDRGRATASRSSAPARSG